MTVETLGGIKTLELDVRDGKAVLITVDMGEGTLTSRLPEDIQVDGEDYRFVGIDVGNPHAVYYMDGIDGLDLERIGPAFEYHQRFCTRPGEHGVHRGGGPDTSQYEGLGAGQRGDLGLRHRRHGQRAGVHPHGVCG